MNNVGHYRENYNLRNIFFSKHRHNGYIMDISWNRDQGLVPL